MFKEKTFCENCRCDVDYIVEDTILDATITRIYYTYKGKIARCANCNSEIFVDDICDFNLEALYNERKRRAGVVSLQ